MKQDEIDDFNKIVTFHGYLVDDFELQEIDTTQYPPDSGIVPLDGKVIIKRKSTKIEQSYQAGSGTDWLGDFADDLLKGAFN